MKKRNIFSLAAMALLTAACSSDEMVLNPADQPAPVEQKIPFTAVISADAAGTRALTEASDGKTITAKWEKEEKVALIHGEEIDVLEVSEVDATTGAATISGTITSPANDESVFVVYVGHQHVNMSQLQESLTGVTGDIAEADISEAMNPMLMTQDGTLKGISDNFDFRLATAKFAVKDSKATFASEVKMPAKYAIWKLNLTTDGTTALKAKQLSMQRKGDEEAHAAVDLDTKTSSEFYLAFIPSTQANAYTFEATDSDDKTYSCTPTVSSALAAGKYYRSTLTMAAAATGNTYRVYTSGTAYTDEAIPSDAVTVTSTTTTWAAGTYLVSDEVTIASDVTLSGDVNLILKDGAELKVNGCIFGGADYDHGFVYKLNIFGQSSGTGKLTVDYSGDHSLGVVTASVLNIHGGEITVKGSSVMQGLEPADLNVYNGTVNATGKANGIIAMGNTHIYGGTVIANSTSDYGAALLSGNDGKTMTISGGLVKATNSGGSAGIETASNNNLVITGGTVVAQGGTQMEGIFSSGTITISGGEVTAKGGAGGNGLEGNIIVNDGNVTAIGGDAIGTDGDGRSGIDGTLTVNGGTVIASGGAKDGTGSDGYGISERSTVTLGAGIKFYEGDAANSMSEASVGDRSKRYSKIE